MRITENQIVRSFLTRTAQTLARMANAQERIASGKKILRPSDDPRGLSKSLAVRSDLRTTATYADNASSASTFMSLTETSLQELSDLLSRAKSTMLEGANGTSGGVAHDALARDVRAMIDEALLIANRKVGGRSLFAGHRTRSTPYVATDAGVRYDGDAGSIIEELGPGLRVAVNLTGPDALQTIPSRILGDVDLDPSVSRVTRLVDLNAGIGVMTGRVRITDSNGVAADLDLLAAETIGEVLDAINNAGTAIVATLAADGSGLVLTDTGGGASFSVEDIEGGTFAAELGIAETSDTGTITGQDLDPAVTDNTPLALLRRGAGLGPGTITIRNSGDDEDLQVQIDPSLANTVGDLRALIDNARTPDGKWLGVRTSIEGPFLALESVRLHTTLSVVDDGGGTFASSLGVGGTGRAEDVFMLLRNAAEALDAGDQRGIESLIASFSAAIEQTAGVRGTYGARARQVIQVAANLSDQKVDLTIRLSDIEDADLTEAAMDLAKAETVYTASLSTGTRVLGTNLFDYIR